jgi:hypothetical protein
LHWVIVVVKIVRALGIFGQTGAICAIASFPLLWIFIFVIFTALPHLLELLGQHSGPPDTMKLYEVKGFVFALYGLSWFGGMADAWRELFPSKLNKSVAKVFREIDAEDKTGEPQAKRLITALTGPWWVFVGVTTLGVYASDVAEPGIKQMIDGATTLFTFSALTLAIPVAAVFVLDTLQWIRTGNEG